MINKKNIYYVDENAFYDMNNEENLYWFGMLLADGCIDVRMSKKGNTSYYISLTSIDLEHIEKFKVFLKTTKNIYYKDFMTYFSQVANKNYTSKPTATLNITNKIIGKRLIDLGMFPRKSLTLKFPEFLKNHPLVNHFIRGYFDGDGCICVKKRKRMDFLHFNIVGTSDMMENILEIFYKNLNINKRKISSNKKSPVFNIHINCQGDVQKIKKFLYKGATVFMDRKKKIFDNHSIEKYGNVTSKYLGICLRKDLLTKTRNFPWRLSFYNTESWKRKEKNFKTEREAFLYSQNLPQGYCVRKPYPCGDKYHTKK